MMESRCLGQLDSLTTSVGETYFCILDLKPSRRENEGNEGGREEHFEDGNVAGVSGLEAFCKWLGLEDAEASRCSSVRLV